MDSKTLLHHHNRSFASAKVKGIRYECECVSNWFRAEGALSSGAVEVIDEILSARITFGFAFGVAS
jgi:hypothetical protein